MDIKHVSVKAIQSATGWDLTGYDTFALKEAIKAAGGKWNAATKTWTVADLGAVLDAANLLSVQRTEEKRLARLAAKAKRTTPEGLIALTQEKKNLVLNALKVKKETGAYYWVIDWVRAHSSCTVHAEYGNTFRVRGSIYTGD